MDIYNPHTKEIAVSRLFSEKKNRSSLPQVRMILPSAWLQEHGLHASLIEDIQSEEQSITFDDIEASKLKVMKYLLPSKEDVRLTLSYNVSILYFENKLFIFSSEPKVIERIKTKIP